MATQEQFSAEINQGYTFQGASILIGGGMLDMKSVPNTAIKLPLKTLNRHGLIAGATGTGKTKTIQTISEKLAENGVSVLMMDIKGDFSGVAEAGFLIQKIKTEQQLLETLEPKSISSRINDYFATRWCSFACNGY
jgi:DNA helicase HerA-like ATPase